MCCGKGFRLLVGSSIIIVQHGGEMTSKQLKELKYPTKIPMIAIHSSFARFMNNIAFKLVYSLPGGFLANQTFFRAPYLAKAFSTSDLDVVSLRLPT